MLWGPLGVWGAGWGDTPVSSSPPAPRLQPVPPPHGPWGVGRAPGSARAAEDALRDASLGWRTGCCGVSPRPLHERALRSSTNQHWWGSQVLLELGGKGLGEGRGLFPGIRSERQMPGAQLEHGAGRGRGSHAKWDGDGDAGAAWASAACPPCQLQPLFFLGEVGNLCPLGSKKASRGKEREKENENDFNFFLA